MSTDHTGIEALDAQARERLSALADGEAGTADLQAALTAWRSPAQRGAGCETWHAYHLIGDVMRSDELAAGARGDAFLARFRERLADEPVVVAPAAVPVNPTGMMAEPVHALAGVRPVARRRRTWAAPAAAAAGVMAVAGVLVVTRMAPQQEPSATVAGTATPVVQSLAPAAVPAAASSVPLAQAEVQPPLERITITTANGTLVRDARLDQYLAAHRQFGGNSALGVPSGFLRGATYDSAQR